MGNGIIIRKALLNDLPAILEMEQLCFAEDSFSKAQFTYLIKKGKGAFYVAENSDRLMAYLSLSFNSGTRNLRIYSIAVHPDCRGLKLGQLLMDKTFEYAREHSVRKITLEVKVSNYPAIGLYKKNGFEATHIIGNYYHDGADAYRMQRVINQK
jgi:[ribosomal protein S18]-alanine N-acetyltransferase